MSLYVRWLNMIKEHADEAWLTDSQRSAYRDLLERWRAAPFVNLYGPQGSGKSFLAGLLVKHHGYAYVFDLADAPDGAPQVIVDDAVYHRALRPLAREKGLGRVLLVTRQPIREAMARRQLTLNARDMDQFRTTLSERLAIRFVKTTPKGTDLARALRQEIIARGEQHVA